MLVLCQNAWPTKFFRWPAPFRDLCPILFPPPKMEVLERPCLHCYSTLGRGVKYCVEYDCCLSTHITRKTCGQTSPNFFCMLLVAVVRSSFSGIVSARYVLPVFWMTSFFIPKNGIQHCRAIRSTLSNLSVCAGPMNSFENILSPMSYWRSDCLWTGGMHV